MVGGVEEREESRNSPKFRRISDKFSTVSRKPTASPRTRTFWRKDGGGGGGRRRAEKEKTA